MLIFSSLPESSTMSRKVSGRSLRATSIQAASQGAIADVIKLSQTIIPENFQKWQSYQMKL
jgi:hypothetical protein